MDYQVHFVTEPGRLVAVSWFEARPEQIASKIPAVFGTVVEYLARIGVTPVGPAVSYYVPKPDRFEVAAGFGVADAFEGDSTVVPLRLPSVEAATTTHVGPYEELGKAYDALTSAVLAHGRELDESAPLWEEYWSPPDTPPEKTRTVVHWPVKPA